jgi:tRNA threonylcarbamoyladenosine biosynthesis protein TsaB
LTALTFYDSTSTTDAVIVLALETVTRAGSVALSRDGTLIAARQGEPDRPHAVRLPGALLDLLAAHDLTLTTLDRLAVCLGPGSFTGIRIGIAAVQGLAIATGLPVVGVTALDALAAAAAAVNGSSSRVAVLIDAARGEVFARRYEIVDGAARALDAAVSLPPAALLGHWGSEAVKPMLFVGDGAIRYAAAIEAAIGRSPDLVQPVPMIASWVARLAHDLPPGSPHALRPVYVRPPDAELARARRAAGAAGG